MKLWFLGIHKLEVSLIDENGNFVSGLTITYELRKSSDNSLVDSGTLIEEGNIYAASVTINEVGQYRIIYFTPSEYENGTEDIVVDTYDNFRADVSLDEIEEKIDGMITILSTMEEKIELIKQIESGRWKVYKNQMIFYNDSGVEIIRFNLYDNQGKPTMESVMERRPV